MWQNVAPFFTPPATRYNDPMTTISVIIPSYNRAHLLNRALDSVLAQSRTADEIILIDDGSTDETAKLMQANYPQVRYLHQKNSGVSAARNRGIQAAKGEWIALLDSDDEWLPDKLAIQMQSLKQAPEHKLIHSDEIWIRNGVRVNQMKKHAKKGGWIYPNCLPLCAISPSASLIHRSLFDELGLFDETLPACEDYDLWLRITTRYPVLYCEEALIKKYGGHEDQLSAKHWGMDRFRIRALQKSLAQTVLKDEDRAAAEKMLMRKLHILLKGARKHQNQILIDQYQPLLQGLIESAETQTI